MLCSDDTFVALAYPHTHTHIYIYMLLLDFVLWTILPQTAQFWLFIVAVLVEAIT